MMEEEFNIENSSLHPFAEASSSSQMELQSSINKHLNKPKIAETVLRVSSTVKVKGEKNTFNDTALVPYKNEVPEDENSIAIHNNTIPVSYTGPLLKMAEAIKFSLEEQVKGSSDYVYWDRIENAWNKIFISNNRAIAINSEGDLPSFSIVDFNNSIRTSMFNSFIDYETLLVELIGNTQKEGVRLVIGIETTVNTKFNDALKIYRQRSKIEYTTDMFAIDHKLIIGKETVKLISAHKPFPIGDINWDIVNDYKLHFPFLDEFLDLQVAARFAIDRKQAFFWLYACSDWGKKFLTDVFKDFGILVEMSIKEIESAFEGKPIGREAINFKNCWILFVDEFKKVNSEVKQLTSEISGSPKNQMNFTAPLYVKLFASAETVDSLAGETGVEAQFSNRFSLIPTLESRISDRPLFIKSSATYFESLKNYVAQYLNTEVEKYIAMGRIRASDYGTKVLADNNKVNRLGSHFGELDDTIKEITWKIKNRIQTEALSGIDDPNFIQVTHNGREAILIQNADKIIEKYIDENISLSEKVKVNHKKSDIKYLIDEGRSSTAKRNKKASAKRVILKNETTSIQRRGIIIYKNLPKG